MSKEITLAELSEAFRKAVIIDIDRKMVFVMNNNRGRIYPEDYYYELVSKIQPELLN